ncbi:trans-sialidase [Trypanosoma conorhini]|uniref:Trans-sialidase n=1 Tax=Trypanosoma conorhini TaxID=83891 RepID=A0A3R7M6X6_9TRYP|nr:trans-sialidase [Trypanosoma conorhini]RNF00574.1 trans-sialidase [Trypanosoma conorhini]
MSLHWPSSAVLLLFLLVCWGGSGAEAIAAETQEASKEVELFKQGEMESRGCGDGELSALGSVFQFNGHSLVAVDGTIVALAEAQHNASFSSEVAIMASSGSRAGSCWETQIVFRKEPAPRFSVTLAGSRAVVKDKKIFLLATSFFEPQSRLKVPPPNDGWEAALVVGDVAAAVAGGRTARAVSWSSPVPLTSLFAEEMGRHAWTIFRGGGSGVVLGSGAIVFPFLATTAADGAVCTVFYSTDDGNTWRFPSSGGAVEGCYAARLLAWEGRLLMITTDGFLRRGLYESGDVGETWTAVAGARPNALGDFVSRGSFTSRGEFVTVNIEGSRAVLLTAPAHSRVAGVPRGRLHLWASDMRRIHDVGLIATGATSLNPFSSLVYADDELFLFYEKEEGSGRGLALKPLSGPLGRLKFVLNTWRAVDTRVSAASCASTQVACGVPVPTAGLVGYLAGTFTGTAWVDEYLGVNATVKGGAEAAGTEGGVTFKGRGSWAEWPVGNEGQNQPYYFANNAFTLAATVTIHAAPEKGESPLPLLGVSMKDGDGAAAFGLSYTSDKMWRVLCGDSAGGPDTGTWEPNKSYNVAIVRQGGGQGFVYIDGVRVGGWQPEQRCETQTGVISHFYIGGDGSGAAEPASEGGRVTVTNVLLYNRPLGADEIGALHKKTVPSSTPEEPTPLQPVASAPSEDVPSKDANATSPAPQRGLQAASSPTPGNALATGHGPSQREAQSADRGGAAADAAAAKSATSVPATHSSSNSSGGGGGLLRQRNAEDGAVRGRRVVPLLLLLGLWAFAAL